MIIAPPASIWNRPAGAQVVAGLGVATILADFDFETYSEAGFVWNVGTQKYICLPNASQGKKGLGVVGAQVYAEHPSTEVLSMYYDLKDGRGRRRWLPGMPAPIDLIAHVLAGQLLEAWNSSFEFRIWNLVCTRLYGWPSLPLAQLRCAMAKSRAFALPGALGKAGDVLDLEYKKDPAGDALLKKFSVPQNPTKKRPGTRITPADEPEEAERLYSYNERDIVSEAEASSRIPDLDATELQYWLMDQEINIRGVQIDRDGVQNCIAIINQAHEKYNRELYTLTGGAVARASELQKLQAWLRDNGLHLDSLDQEHLEEALAIDDKIRRGMRAYVVDAEAGTAYQVSRLPMPPHCRRALEIREKVGSAAVKKVYALANSLSAAGRVHDLYTYHGAHTGRCTGNGAQPTNLPNSGPAVFKCDACAHHFCKDSIVCPWCATARAPGKKLEEWGPAAVEDALQVIATRSLEVVEHYFGDAMAAVSGCLRGLFVAAPGMDLLCSDYSAIEAVVLAMIAGEQWRIDVFRTHGKIYEMSAAKITGIPFEDFMRHFGYTDAELAAPDWYTRKPAAKGSHHPERKKIGKVAELASGFQGWIGSWIAFGADEFMDEKAMKKAILAWRKASLSIVEFWGGQHRGMPWEDGYRAELFGVEGAFIKALLEPGVEQTFRGFKFLLRADVLYLTLLSGRTIKYHRPRLRLSTRRQGEYSISYEGWNTNPKNGATGWIRKDTWGGRMTENIVQATARDIQWHGMLALRAAGYPIVLHVYDEDVPEVPEGFGSVEEVERIMSTMPAWAHDWPIKANGGWRGKRYRKD